MRRIRTLIVTLILTLPWPVLGQSPSPTKAPALPVERRLAITGQGYFPVSLRLKDGRIVVVLRGGAPHVGIGGRLDMIFSSDEGKTWSEPVVVNDSPIDDSSPAIGEAKDGTLVVGFWRCAAYDEKGKYTDKLTSETCTTWVTRSKDGGRTWSEATPIDVSDIEIGSPYGRIVTLPDGTMLMPIYGYQVRPAGTKLPSDRNHSYIYRSTDDGRTWKRLSEIGDSVQQLNETALLRLPSGKILAAVRSRKDDVWLSESTDNGATWSKTEPLTPLKVHPADLCLLPDGRILLTVGNRLGEDAGYGVFGMVSDANGRFGWEKRFALMADALSRDCGYPSSVVLKDGRVLTLYYAVRVKQRPEWRVHCGALIFDVPKP